MVMPSSVANSLTNTNADRNRSIQVAQEIGLLENRIRAAARVGLTSLVFDARVVGNPIDDPLVDSHLSDAQIDFRDALLGAKYRVGRDNDSGWWSINWAPTGPETQVSIYTFRTILSPGSVSTQTISLIQDYLRALSPAITAKAVQFVPTGSGGNVDETLFGATASTFYEYVIIASQQNDTDHSSALKTALVAGSLGYTTNNCHVFKVI